MAKQVAPYLPQSLHENGFLHAMNEQQFFLIKGDEPHGPVCEMAVIWLGGQFSFGASVNFVWYQIRLFVSLAGSPEPLPGMAGPLPI